MTNQKSITIQAGKYYLRRNGERVGPAIYRTGQQVFKWRVGNIIHKTNGSALSDNQSQFDIVEDQ